MTNNTLNETLNLRFDLTWLIAYLLDLLDTSRRSSISVFAWEYIGVAVQTP